MVWAISMPSNFGQHFPDGEFAERPGYDGSRKFTEDLGHVEEHERPINFKTRKPYDRLKDLIKTENRLLAVSEPLRDLIERLEPGVHQFWPINITVPNMAEKRYEPYPAPYFAMVVMQHLDSFSPERSDPDAFDAERPRVLQPHAKSASGIAISKEAVGNAHLWREARLRGPAIYLSNTLNDEMKRLELTSPRHLKLKEV